TSLHMPRLDWQMWFAALGECRGNAWFVAFQQRLLLGSEPVVALLERAPSGSVRYTRSTRYQYQFAKDAVWQRAVERQDCPTRSRAGFVVVDERGTYGAKKVGDCSLVDGRDRLSEAGGERW